MKKILSLVLCSVMLLSVMSLGAFAEETTAVGVDESVIDLTTNVATAPVLDGVINEGEYTYNHGTVLNAETGDNLWEAIDDKGAIISVDFPYTGGFREISWSLAADDDYLYIAATMKKESGSDPQFEVMIFNTVAGPDYSRRNAIKADGTVKPEEGATWSFEDTVAVSDNGSYTFEGKISREQLGLSKSEIYLLSRVWAASPECFLMFGVGAQAMTIKVTPLADASEEPVADYKITDLEGYGQLDWTIEGKAEDAPIADGIIEDGEYTLAVKDMKPSEDESDNRFFCVDPQGLDVENFNLYLSYDDDYIYIGAEVFEDEILAGENITFRFGLDPRNFEKRINIKYTHGAAPESNEAEAFATELIDGGISYEIVIKRTAMTDYLGLESNDDVKEFTLQIVMGDDRDEVNHPELWPEMWFGCSVPGYYEGLASSAEATDAEGKIWGFMGTRFPHVMTLGDAPETEAPVTDEPETEAPETNTPETNAPETNAPETEAPKPEGGCGASVAAIAVALVAALGTCTAFVAKKRD